MLFLMYRSNEKLQFCRGFQLVELRRRTPVLLMRVMFDDPSDSTLTVHNGAALVVRQSSLEISNRSKGVKA